MTDKLKKIFNGIKEYFLSIFIFIIIWGIYVKISGVAEYIVPSPIKVIKRLFEIMISGEIWPHFFATSGIIFIGYFIGIALGLIFGYMIEKITFLKKMILPYIIFFQTAPKIALVPLFVIWFGLGLTSKLILIISMVFFPIMVSTMDGISSVPKDMRNLMKILNANKYQIIFKMELPYSMPMIFSGLKIGMVQAIIGAIVAEWISGKIGLGYILIFASSTFDTTLLIAGIFFTIIVGIFYYELVNIIEKKVLYWHESQFIK